ncbi:MAG TPA: hypothetical protein VNA15_10125 [Candidatus Angelobacter sp.]|nr:hypothetical protein [Candidatus Angelobacter sp.]
MNRSGHDSPEEIQRQIHQMAQNIFTDEPEPIGGEVDLQRLFIRILDKEDWTDKLASELGKIRKKIAKRRTDTKSSEKPRTVNNRPHRGAKLPDQSRTKNSRPHWDMNLPKELQSLIPDMREVAKAYAEMTNGYKDFIRDVVKANRLRQTRQEGFSSTEDRSDVGP